MSSPCCKVEKRHGPRKILNIDGITKSDDAQMAATMNDYFASIGETLNSQLLLHSNVGCIFESTQERTSNPCI